MNCKNGTCKYTTTCAEKGECRADDDKSYCPHYGLARVDGNGCPDCNFEEDVEAVIACLGDDAETLRDPGGIRGPDAEFSEIIANMEAAAKHLRYFMDCRALSCPVREEPF